MSPIEQIDPGEEKSELTHKSSNEDDWEVPEEELDKVRLLLKHQEAVNISITPEDGKDTFVRATKN